MAVDPAAVWSELNARHMRGFRLQPAPNFFFAQIRQTEAWGELPDQPMLSARAERCRVAPDSYHVEMAAVPVPPGRKRLLRRRASIQRCRSGQQL